MPLGRMRGKGGGERESQVKMNIDTAKIPQYNGNGIFC